MQKFVDFKEWILSMLTGQNDWLAAHFQNLFHSYWTYAFIFGISLLTTSVSFIDKDKRNVGYWGQLTNFVMVAFPVAMLLMQVALLTLGREGCTWWCDPNRLGGWKSLLFIGLFFLLMLAQWIAAAVYVTCVKHEAVDDEDEKWSGIEFSTLMVSLVLFYPVSSWILYHVGSWIHLPGIVAIILWLLIPIGGLVSTWLVNSGTFGFGRGTLFTLISVCIAVGLLAGMCCLMESVIVLYHYLPLWKLVPFIVLAIACFVLLAYNEKDGGSLSDGTKIIFYWWENPGWIGVIVAAIMAYIAAHFWFHWI